MSRVTKPARTSRDWWGVASWADVVLTRIKRHSSDRTLRMLAYGTLVNRRKRGIRV